MGGILFLTDKETKISIGDNSLAAILFGNGDENFRYLRSIAAAEISARGSDIHIKGKEEDVNFASDLIYSLLDTVENEHQLTINDINYTHAEIRIVHKHQ
jgi:phosphate starvation-inducible PhoH-like protein